ncbi:MAG: hypothetical protein IKR34_07575 [Candidatus Gastranaerophilales bacterium]|nr:hypothetical protein [Candidatus Gastranaerophilales bacterium]
MKKINFLITAIVLFIACFDCANALVTTQQANNVKRTYQIYRSKLRTCSPYTYNVDGVPAIARIEGIYNRRCLVRFFTENDTTECNFKNDSLRQFVKSQPNANEYAMYFQQNLANMSGNDKDKMVENFLKTLFNLADNIADGTCKSNNVENQNNNNAQ